MRSLRDTAFALDAPSGQWSLRASLGRVIWPALPRPALTTVSVLALVKRFGAAGATLRAFSKGSSSAWPTLNRATIVQETRARLRDPAVMRQGPTGFCGPITILMEWARRNPQRYVLGIKELFETGKLTCVTGRVIVAEQELREEQLTMNIAQVDWLMAGTMRDDENIWEDVEGDSANDLETITTWGEQYEWTRDVLGLPNIWWETCFVSGEVDVMRKVRNAVSAGGVGFFCIDSCLITDGGTDDEENAWWRMREHEPGQEPPLPVFGEQKHSEDDGVAPDHWVVYLGGMSLSADPSDDDPLEFTVWSWNREYKITCTVDAFSEYLYAGVTGTP